MIDIREALETNTAPRFSAKVLAFTKSGLENHIDYLQRYLSSVSPRVSVYAQLSAELVQCRLRYKTMIDHA